jgi:hypothetical protein
MDFFILLPADTWLTTNRPNIIGLSPVVVQVAKLLCNNCGLGYQNYGALINNYFAIKFLL